MGAAALVSVLSYVLVDRATADTIAGAALLAGTAIGLIATLLSWRAGSSADSTATSYTRAVRTLRR